MTTTRQRQISHEKKNKITETRGGNQAGNNNNNNNGSDNLQQLQQQAGKIRKLIFPIYGMEVKKFLLIGSIKFFIILALTLTRDTKDTLVVTQCGAEAIAFLKVCYIMSCHVFVCL